MRYLIFINNRFSIKAVFKSLKCIVLEIMDLIFILVYKKVKYFQVGRENIERCLFVYLLMIIYVYFLEVVLKYFIFGLIL